jgi:hypothetical protein
MSNGKVWTRKADYCDVPYYILDIRENNYTLELSYKPTRIPWRLYIKYRSDNTWIFWRRSFKRSCNMEQNKGYLRKVSRAYVAL